jgi:hypothetical protein
MTKTTLRDIDGLAGGEGGEVDIEECLEGTRITHNKYTLPMGGWSQPQILKSKMVPKHPSRYFIMR